MNNTAEVMQIPTAIEQYITQHQMTYKPVAASAEPVWAVPVLFVIESQPVLVVTPSDQLIDIARLRVVLGAEVRPAPEQDKFTLLSQLDCTYLPIFSSLVGGAAVLVDESLGFRREGEK